MSYNLQNIQVLLVEDNQPMMNLIKGVLLSFGVGNVITALDGEEGFKEFCLFNPDLVITDWMMAPRDGLYLSRKIRTDPKSPNKYVPIILMTGFSEKQRVISARDEGVTEFLVKPFNTRDLYRRMYKIIEAPRQYISSAGYFGPDRRRKRKDHYDGPKRRSTDVETDEDLYSDVNPGDIGDIDFR